MVAQIEVQRGTQIKKDVGPSEPLKGIEATLGSTYIHFLPAGNVVTNADIAELGFVTRTGKPFDEAKIFEVTGIETRRVAGEDDTVQSMAEQAASPVVDEFRSKINAVDFLTSYPDTNNLLPGLNHAATLAQNLRLPNILSNPKTQQPEALDRHMACSGFADAFFSPQAHIGDRVLIVGSEIYSPTLEGLDKAVFADGAGAMSFDPRDITILGSLSRGPEDFLEEENMAIQMPIDYPAIRQPAVFLNIPLPMRHGEGDLGKFSMDGNAVYRLMLKHIPSLTMELIRQLRLDLKKIAVIAAHQPTFKVLNDVKRYLPEELRDKLYINVKDGNYSSVSIMKALAELINEGQVKLGDTVVMIGFGAGLHIRLGAARFNK